jgi:predicted AAA+ superfamily ATPase
LAQHSGKLVILDEIQKMPNLFAILRGVIDSGRREEKRYGRFLLLALRQSGESLAGRRVRPIDCSETDIDLTTIWSRSGFPESLLAQIQQDSPRQRSLIGQVNL